MYGNINVAILAGEASERPMLGVEGFRRASPPSRTLSLSDAHALATPQAEGLNPAYPQFTPYAGYRNMYGKYRGQGL